MAPRRLSPSILDDASIRSGTTGGSSSTEEPPEGADFHFNEALDMFWLRCEHFVSSVSNTHRIHPLHIALALLYANLRTALDPRLFGHTEMDPAVLERPLFWVAIERVSRPVLANSFDEHLENTTWNGVQTTATQYLIGAALWDKIQRLSPGDFVLLDVEFSTENTPLEKACEATRQVLDRAKELYLAHGDTHMAPHHVLLAVLELSDSVRGVLDSASQRRRFDALAHFAQGEHPLDDEEGPQDEGNNAVDARPSMNPEDIIDTIRKLRKRRITSHMSRILFPWLTEFATDQTQDILEKLRRGEIIDPITGRNREIRRLISILSRKSKNNAVLLGDPGVGKSAIAEGLALRIVQGKVPELLIARVFSLDLGGLLASTACKSAYEQIIQAIIDEIIEHDEMGIHAILFIDDLSQLTIGGYREDGNGIDAATLLKPFLASGQIRCVGCSTFEDFRNTIEKDGALTRQFSPVIICEPTVDETICILQGMKASLEMFHRVHILEEAFINAAHIASQYFAHKRLPDSAIDLLDEACANTKIGKDTLGDKLGKYKRRQVILEIHIQSLETDIRTSAGGVDEQSLQAEVDDLRRELAETKAQISDHFESRKATIPLEKNISKITEMISRTEQEVMTYDKAGQEQNKRKAIQTLLRLKEREDLTLLELSDAHNQDLQNCLNPPTSKPLVTKCEVREVASWYRPINFHGGSNDDLHMEDIAQFLSRKIVAQPDAVESISSAVRCLLKGLTDPNRPVASFLFGGPSGSGKVLLAKELATALLGCSEKLIRIHGEDYAEDHSLSRLLGTPACTGFDHGGKLTECVRRRPSSIILIQDIEKASPDFQVLIQTILDEGTVRDGAGKVVDFTNCIVIITTSIGQAAAAHTHLWELEQDLYRFAIRAHFPAEFLSRIDDVIVFRRTTEDSMPAIVASRLDDLVSQLSRVKLGLEVTKASQEYLCQAGWSSTGGAHIGKIIKSLYCQI